MRKLNKKMAIGYYLQGLRGKDGSIISENTNTSKCPKITEKLKIK